MLKRAVDLTDEPTEGSELKGSELKRPSIEEPLPTPDMSLLHAPVRRGMSRTEWEQWFADRKADSDRRFEDSDDWDQAAFESCLSQERAAIYWAAPEEMALSVVVQGGQVDGDAAPSRELCVRRLTRDDEVTYRSVIDAACASAGLQRERYHWNLLTKPDPKYPRPKVPANDDLLRQVDFKCYPWHPKESDSWVTENTYSRSLVGTPKILPVAPTAEPELQIGGYRGFKCAPPAHSAGADAWSHWLDSHCCGGIEFWKAREEIIEWRCPPRLALTLVGVSHSHTVDVGSDEPLALALAAFCAAKPAAAAAMSPGDLLLRNARDDEDVRAYLDPQLTTMRGLYSGPRKPESGPLALLVLYRDEARTERECGAKHGEAPQGFVELRGSAYRCGPLDAPWLVRKEGGGVGTFNRVCEEALALYQGSACRGPWAGGVPAYDPFAAWFGMLACLKKLLGSVVRAPRGGWSDTAAMAALDNLVGFFLVTLREDEWRRDARGKIMSWDERCRLETASLVKSMDKAASKVVLAMRTTAAASDGSGCAGEFATSRGACFGVGRALDQMKRLAEKLQTEYKNVNEGAFSGTLRALNELA
mmetsp:Transcript_46756/g.94307  ORF Transcript_46756/g.94307 Transcript_46756/m.94307 type:complete len:589 (-) Transcript_46756:205-1971(-)